MNDIRILADLFGPFCSISRQGKSNKIVPLDRDDQLQAALRSAKGSSVDLAWACIPPVTSPTPSSGKRREERQRTPDSASDVTEDGAEASAKQNSVIFVHLGVTSTKGGLEPNKLTITIRTDRMGVPIDARTLTLDKLQGAVDTHTPHQYDRATRRLFGCRTDSKGAVAKDMTLLQDDADVQSAFSDCLGTNVIRVAIELQTPAPAPAPASKGVGRPWNPLGGIAASAASAASSGRIGHDEVANMVTDFWREKLWPTVGNKQQMAIRYHAHQIMNNPQALAEAERTGRVTFVPNKWFHFNPTTQAESHQELHLPFQPAQAAVPIQPALSTEPNRLAQPSQITATEASAVAAAESAATEFILVLASAQLKDREKGLREAGYVEVDDLKLASDAALMGAGLKDPEIKRLRRYLEKRAEPGSMTHI